MTDQEQPAATEPRPEAKLGSQIERYMQPIIDCIIRGMLNTMVLVPTKMTLVAFCRVTGFLMGNLYAGDIDQVLAFRMEAKKAFKEGINRTEPQPLKRAN